MLDRISLIFEHVIPRQSVYIAMDGPAANAKVPEQRRRRRMRAPLRSWNQEDASETESAPLTSERGGYPGWGWEVVGSDVVDSGFAYLSCMFSLHSIIYIYVYLSDTGWSGVASLASRPSMAGRPCTERLTRRLQTNEKNNCTTRHKVTL